MLDMGFLPAIKQILRLVPSQRQTLLFSATMPPAILALAQSIMRQPLRISIEPERPTAELVEQFVRHVPRAEKADVLIRLLVDLNADRTLVFSRTKHGADRIVRQLGKAGILADAIHSNKSQNRRQRILADFKLARTTVLVATDIAARGIDVDGISHVVNFDMPEEPETYVHRIGRSGRAGATGVAISLCDPEERKWLRDIERLIGRRIAVQTDHAATGSDAMTPRRNERASAVAPAAKRHDIARVSIEHLDRDGEPLAATTAVAAPARFRPAHKWRPAKSFRRFGSKPAGNRRRKSARI
jgi:ATP-dependent RNA helicase RhlE